jgi:hypothetical protein
MPSSPNIELKIIEGAILIKGQTCLIAQDQTLGFFSGAKNEWSEARGKRWPAGNPFRSIPAGNPAFPSQLRRCATHLLQNSGDIRTVRITGPFGCFERHD